MQISYTEHDAMAPFIDLIRSVYIEMGIATTFYPVPITRGFTELNTGQFDADVVRAKQNTLGFPNILVIEPIIFHAQVLLICKKQLPCNKGVLQNSQNVILTNSGNSPFLKTFEIKAKLVVNEKLNTNLDMLRRSRVDYLIYPTTTFMQKYLTPEFGLLELSSAPLHHVIHVKHRHLAQDIARILRNKLKTFDPEQPLLNK